MNLITTLTIHDVEYDCCVVEYELSDPEPEVNWPGGVDIVSVTQFGRDITSLVSGRDLANLADECSEHGYTVERERAEEAAERRNDWRQDR